MSAVVPVLAFVVFLGAVAMFGYCAYAAGYAKGRIEGYRRVSEATLNKISCKQPGQPLKMTPHRNSKQ